LPSLAIAICKSVPVFPLGVGDVDVAVVTDEVTIIEEVAVVDGVGVTVSFLSTKLGNT